MFIAITISTHTIEDAGQFDATLSDQLVRKSISWKIIMGKLLYFIKIIRYRTFKFDVKAESLCIHVRRVRFVITVSCRHFVLVDDIINRIQHVIVLLVVIYSDDSTFYNSVHIL